MKGRRSEDAEDRAIQGHGARHLYAHIPFCRSRCAYCDFASEPLGSHLHAGRVAAYVERLRAELHAEMGPIDQGQARNPLETVYLGGGTPTVLPKGLLLPLVAELAGLQAGAEDPEFTIEANPGTVNVHLLAELAAAGVTRLSLGVQSFSPRLRANLGRRTEQGEVEAALRDVGEVVKAGEGLREWNLDLVFGIPGQTWSEALDDIDAAVAARPAHISLYDLTYTPAYEARVARTAGADAREAAGAFSEQHLPAAAARLEAAGYRRYEVSNFATPGHECRHNQAYWRGEDYLGLGASAVSTIRGERRTRPVRVGDYLTGRAPLLERLSPRTRLWEKAMLGLRTWEGVVLADVLPVLDEAALGRLLGQDCVRECCGRLRLNPAFLDVSNTVISALLAPTEGS